ncbi:SDR family NAD(P)-dependent oxidoreductase [Arachnia propionica]|uniref:SDR family NAD(P)-dependent oxidoreductase n=1 Tax=Arachnia propionica TaxID=1750 RepID=A0AB37I2D6_9ACTN|nr:SDR family NAD(P)-dependent oxidoreductase [Arachnia propionica]QCT37392.1 SDR family NAD(P)-dependent oxidoreductase [Arachnia propionica]QUC10259.1 SDR family NAD(P)-dependent oxidoreductase [Arachnia propionica]RPA17162.1 SDR family NAD(P)-dependent oxidoreductase [Arachnia propionica]
MMKIQGSTPLAQKNVAFESVASAPHTGAFLTHCWQRPNDEFLGMRDANGNTRLLSGTNLVGATARIGSFLENFLEPQQRILIAIDDGLDFSQAFLGCLHANVTAVVTATSNFTADDWEHRIGLLVEDASVTAVLADESTGRLLNASRFLDRLDILEFDDALKYEGELRDQRPVDDEDVALVLYTSGSTSNPKGVCLTQQALWDGACVHADWWRVQSSDTVSTWLSNAHIFGLHLNLLVPLAAGCRSIQLRSDLFLDDPVEWLRALQAEQATHTGAPNFAFELAARCVADQAPDLDLSSLKAAVCAGEPIRSATVAEFSRTLGSRGFNEHAFCPYYAATETQAITGARAGEAVRELHVDPQALLGGSAIDQPVDQGGRALVSCGRPGSHTTVLIVDEAGRVLPSRKVGEIYVKTRDVATGYLSDPELTSQVFDMGVDGQTGFYRTGDLGVIVDGELFIVGRIRDILIAGGKNHHLADLEETVRRGVPGLPGRTVLVAVDDEQAERLVALQEAVETLPVEDMQDFCERIVSALSMTHGLSVHDVVVVPSEAFAASAKLRRRELGLQYLEGTLPTLYSRRGGFVPRPPLPEDMTLGTEQWLPAPHPAAGQGPRGATLVFLDDDQLRSALATQFRTLGIDGELMWASDMSDGLTGQMSDAELADLARRGGAVNVLHLHALERPGMTGSHQLPLRLLRSCLRVGLSPERIMIASRMENDLARIHVDSWIGFERSLKCILPETRLQILGLDAECTDVAAVVASEWATTEPSSAFYVQGSRLISQQRDAEIGLTGASRMRRGGTYLVVGGLGGIGMALAEHLLTDWSANVVLVGRGAPRPEVKRVLSGLGCPDRILVCRADVSDSAAMDAVVADVLARFGDLHGIFHAGGVRPDSTLAEKTDEQFQAAVAAKTDGTLVLQRLAEQLDLDFVVLFSSSAAIVGDFGGCDYSVANRFQMAWATAPASGRTHRLAVNWPMWGSLGMGEADEASSALSVSMNGQRLLQPAEGLAVLDRLLEQPGHQYSVTVGQQSSRPSVVVTKTASEAGTAESRPAPTSSLPINAQVEWEIKEVIEEILAVAPSDIDSQEPLRDLGFDSVALVELAGMLNCRFDLALTPDVFFSHNTVARLGTHLLEQHADRLETRYGARRNAATNPTRGSLTRRTRSSGQRLVPKDGPVVEASSTDNVATIAKSSAAAWVTEPLALIGRAGRFPGARDVDGLWEILSDGRCMVAEPPRDRAGWWRDGEESIRSLAAIEGPGEFDPLFFEISPREAEAMDPRQRLLLQEMWHALEDAAVGSRELSESRVGVFVGIEEGDYQRVAGDAGTVASNHNAILADRLSYFLDLTGPAMAINTACSSGLVAFHEACNALRAGECDLAVVAAANILATSELYDAMSRAGMLSASGVCRAFDERADGLVPGEAVVAVVLQRRDEALRRGRRVLASVLGSGVNADGRTNGITAPSGEAQESLIRGVLERSGVSADRVGHVVAHGTGTRLGDPVEVNALVSVFGGGSCVVSSVKPNVGHALAASGLVSLVSLVEGMRHELIAPSILCECPSDYVDWDSSGLVLAREGVAWPAGEGARIGAVSAFGFSGTNAHVLLEAGTTLLEELVPAPDEAASGALVLALSACTDEVLTVQLEQLAEWMKRYGNDEAVLPKVAHTLQTGRHLMNHRCAVIASTLEEAIVQLKRAAKGESGRGIHRGVVDRGFEARRHLQQLVDQTLIPDAGPERFEGVSLLADLFCQGYDIGLARQFPGIPGIVSLPGYPFSRDVYWLDGRANGRAIELHPLVHRNTSRLGRVSFESSFDAAPEAIAALEMARVSCLLALGLNSGDVVLTDVQWGGPLSTEMSINVQEGNGSDLEWAFNDPTGRILVQGRGHVSYEESVTQRRPLKSPDVVEAPAPRAYDETTDIGIVQVLATMCGALAGGSSLSLVDLEWTALPAAETKITRIRTRARWTGDTLSGDADLLNEDGEVIGSVRGLRGELRRAARSSQGQCRAGHTDGHGLAARVADDIRQVMASVLGLPTNQIDDGESLASYGFDSLRLTELARELGARLGAKVTPDLFFRHPTIGRLRDHFTAIITPSSSEESEVVMTDEETVGRAVELTGWPTRSTGGAREPVAIVGMAGRFPGARDVDAFWKLLASGTSAVATLPSDRRPWWTRAESSGAPLRAGWVEGPGEFDPLFFEISPREAEAMDPRQRLLLQEMWHALEDAAVGSRELSESRVGVFVGVEESNYPQPFDEQPLTANSNSALAGRLSYFLDLTGPAMAISTACSSGLVAFHEACNALRAGECDLAVVAAAALLASENDYLVMSRAGMLSASGVCRAFDERADGLVPGEAVVAVVLQRRDEALRRGRRILASVLGSGVNADGRTNGITAPSGEAQESLIRGVLERSGVSADRVGHVVAHGTGTRLGDPVEVNALVSVFGGGSCVVSSVKPNVGHALATSGLVSLVSLVEGMRHELIAPSILCECPSDYVDWDSSGLVLAREGVAWPAGEGARIGAVSAFGFSGTNAHVLLEAGTTLSSDGLRWEQAPSPDYSLIVLSARTEEALDVQLTQLADWLDGDGARVPLPAVSRTLGEGRVHQQCRFSLVATDTADAVEKLRREVRQERPAGSHRGRVRRGFQPNPALARVHAELIAGTPGTGGDELQARLEAIGELFCQGYEPDWSGFWTGSRPEFVGLPGYRFAAETYWVEPPNSCELPASLLELEEDTSTWSIEYQDLFPDDTFVR